MEAPLLALTRKRTAVAPETVAAANMRQLAQLRWIAVAGQTATILVVHFGLGVTLPVGLMLGAVALLAIANCAAWLALPRHRVRNIEIMLALLLDMGTLTFQLYLSGGAANPFISLYLLQVVLGAILLPTTLAAILVAATAISYAGLTLRFVPLTLPTALIADSADLFTIGRWIAFVLVAGLLVLFITRISRNLSAREAYLADLRQRATEEEGIVRMGLFASGAAHELGTPLGSLAVILADWRRMPAVMRNPDLAGDVADMQAEIQRCKSIVSDVLHSAGQPRSESLENAVLADFVNAVADGWHRANPDVDLIRDTASAGSASIVADPALRQAIWILLDNAAEMSPRHVAIEAHIADDLAIIAVRDRGPGFAPDALATVGKLYQSTKGAGHGLGLFLATNVARRLGGRLEASNGTGGGADVRLVLPLASAKQEG